MHKAIKVVEKRLLIRGILSLPALGAVATVNDSALIVSVTNVRDMGGKVKRDRKKSKLRTLVDESGQAFFFRQRGFEQPDQLVADDVAIVAAQWLDRHDRPHHRRADHHAERHSGAD